VEDPEELMIKFGLTNAKLEESLHKKGISSMKSQYKKL
jgi:hypothetical protein